ncbi:hypothetical protein [Halosimplex halophilum]|uniref:hypothetical protein n=1 Tax=Halosimplex halophilum TaxID=2559572 RepID=UPI00107F602B|nr:hypothetical protein [Halosimplex halophilum]
MRDGTRTVAAVALLAGASLAGCLGTGSVPEGLASGTAVANSGSDATAATAGGTAAASAETPTPSVGTPPDCSGGETAPRIGSSGGLPAGADGFDLTASERVVERGDAVEFELTNVADGERSTGTRHRYALQRLDGEAWRTVTRFPAGRGGFNATAHVHDPGEGFEWSFRASAAGFSAGKFVVCEALPAGEYRFVYDGPPALAVRFELVGAGDGTPVSEHVR